MIKLEKILLFTICVILAIILRVTCVGAQETTAKLDKDTCFALFQQIIETQNTRRAYQLGFEETLLRHEENKISKEQYDAYLTTWKDKENELRTKVTALYNHAYAGSCFNYKK